MVSVEQNSPRYALSSVDNALRLLLLVRERDEIRLSDAAAELGVANSTAHRLLGTLAHRGFVVQDRSRVYRLGPVLAPKPVENQAERLQRVAAPYLHDLRDRTDETVHLVELEGNGTRFLDCAESAQVLRVASRIGMLLPAHTNSGGKAMLARLTDVELRALYPRGLPPVPGSATTTLSALRRELAATRRRGYGVNLHESTRGVSAVGRHIEDPGGTVLGALVVAGPSARCERRRLTELAVDLVETAETIETEL